MNSVIFPGSFDPVTLGHLELIERLAKTFERVYIIVSVNYKKNPMFNADLRSEFLTVSTKQFANVEVLVSNDLVVNDARKLKCTKIVRGVRNVHDFTSEQQLAYVNKSLAPEIETLLLIASQEQVHISSSTVKELINFNSSIVGYVPEIVNNYYEKEMKEGQ